MTRTWWRSAVRAAPASPSRWRSTATPSEVSGPSSALAPRTHTAAALYMVCGVGDGVGVGVRTHYRRTPQRLGTGQAISQIQLGFAGGWGVGQKFCRIAVADGGSNVMFALCA